MAVPARSAGQIIQISHILNPHRWPTPFHDQKPKPSRNRMARKLNLPRNRQSKQSSIRRSRSHLHHCSVFLLSFAYCLIKESGIPLPGSMEWERLWLIRCWNKSSDASAQLLRCCKQIYADCLPILYGENVFTSTYCNGFELKLVKPHIRRRFGFSAGNIDSIRHIQIDVGIVWSVESKVQTLSFPHLRTITFTCAIPGRILVEGWAPIMDILTYTEQERTRSLSRSTSSWSVDLETTNLLQKSC